MGNIQYRDSNRELVMKLAEIHRSGVDATEACAELGVAFEDAADMCWECDRKIRSGGIERAVQLVKNARLDSPKADKRIPSHETARRRAEAEDNKTSYDEETGNGRIQQLEAELREAQQGYIDLQSQLDGALAKISEMQSAEPVVPETVTRPFLAKVLKQAEPGLLDQIPHLGGERISDIKDWATATLE